MSEFATRLQALSSAEDFLEFFGVPYEPRVVHVNRLHILKRFTQYLNREGACDARGEDTGPDDVAVFRRYRELLLRAYGDFVHSNAQREKVFKVFHDAAGTQHVGVSSLRETLAGRRQAA